MYSINALRARFLFHFGKMQYPSSSLSLSLFSLGFRCKAWWCAILVSTLSWFRKRRISDSVAVPPLFMVAIDVLLRAVCARSASTSRCMTASKLFWKVWIFGSTSSSWACHRSEAEIKVLHRSESRVTSRRIARLSSLRLRFSVEVPPKNAQRNLSKINYGGDKWKG